METSKSFTFTAISDIANRDELYDQVRRAAAKSGFALPQYPLWTECTLVRSEFFTRLDERISVRVIAFDWSHEDQVEVRATIWVRG